MTQKLNKKIANFIYRVNNTSARAVGSILGNAVNAYWYDQVPNFGDLLNPILFKYYGLTPLRSSRSKADVLAIGSVLDKQPEDYSGFIAGAGLMHDISRRFFKAKILAVRGELTRERIGAPKGITLGDPGLLIARFHKSRSKKKYVLGLVPHYKDKEDDRLQRIKRAYQHKTMIIDVQRSPKEVIREIDQCAYILSSSLHGLVTADALGIPNGWMLLSENVFGHGFKFFDYASAFGGDIRPNYITGHESLSELTKLTNNVGDNIAEVQYNLDIVFSRLTMDILDLRRRL
jgi:pyruvyltransferase